MPDLPTGTLTMLFTDIEGSTRLLQQLGPADYAQLLGEHHRSLRAAIARCGGTAVKTEGDSFFAVFPNAVDAVRAAVEAQRALATIEWPTGVHVGVRMGLHTGDVDLTEGEYVGLDIHRAARIAAAAHGGQVLLSETTHQLLVGKLADEVATIDLGEHRLKDLDLPEHIHQLVIAGLASDFPPIHALAMRLDLLPAEQTTFIGRERELGRAAGLLGETRLLTLTGPGGTGKTRLSIALARRAADSFTDGVAFIPLAAISDPELVAPTIRQALGFAEESGRTPLETLTDQLRHREALLVLDNFEQITDAAPVVGQLLESSEQLKIVVTSRGTLHLTGEQELPVPPLDVPAPSGPLEPDRLLESESVALFVQRARAVRPDFALTDDNARAIVEICARLDGLPLAIELAASRVKLLPVSALVERLGRRLDLLQSTAADRTDRQRTLRGAIAWSYELLNPEEQALFRRLAIFVGGWRLEDAEPVVSAGGALPLDVLDGLSRLLDHSLIRALDTPAEPRFGMLETIREYGLEQLNASGEQPATARAHAEALVRLIADSEANITRGAEWPDRLEREHANIRAALAWLGEHDIETALSSAGSIWRFWHVRGHLREGRSILANLLARPAAAATTPARAKGLIGMAGLAYWQSDYETARTAYEEALSIARSAADRTLEVETLYSLAYVRGIEHEWDGAIEAYREGMDLYRAMGNEVGVAWSTMGIGMITTLRGDHEQAVPLLDEAQAAFDRLKENFGYRNTISVKERALVQLGRLDEANQLNRELIELAHAAHDPTSLSTALRDQASIEALEGDFERSARLVGASDRLTETAGGQAPPELINRIEPLPVLEQRLDGATLEQLLAEGRKMTDEQAVQFALASQPVGNTPPR
jgi:predicted ATPase/class 3 adenylate cyclase